MKYELTITTENYSAASSERWSSLSRDSHTWPTQRKNLRMQMRGPRENLILSSDAFLFAPQALGKLLFVQAAS